jgi:hypothetical protein
MPESYERIHGAVVILDSAVNKECWLGVLKLTCGDEQELRRDTGVELCRNVPRENPTREVIDNGVEIAAC